MPRRRILFRPASRSHPLFLPNPPGVDEIPPTTITLARTSGFGLDDVVYPKGGAEAEEIELPGNTQAFTDTPIYSRTNGYVKDWYVDIGARVKQGQLLAVIETPELDRQLRQAKADLLTAEANNRIAQARARRVHALLPTQSVSAHVRSGCNWASAMTQPLKKPRRPASI